MDANPNGNYYELSANQTLHFGEVYLESGDQLQVGVYVQNIDGVKFDLDNRYTEEVLLISVEKSSSTTFEDTESIVTAYAAGFFRNIDVAEGHYRVSITNLTTQRVGIGGGHASANIGLVILFILSVVMFSITIAIFAAAFGITIAMLVLLAIFYPIYLLIKSENEKNSRRKQFYPNVYATPQYQKPIRQDK
jgi:hypothetical protein